MPRRGSGAGRLTEGDHGPRKGCGRRGLPPREAATRARGASSPQASPAARSQRDAPSASSYPSLPQSPRSGPGQSQEKGVCWPSPGNRGLSGAGSPLSRDSRSLLSALALTREAAAGRLIMTLQWSVSCRGSWFLWKIEGSNFSLALNPDRDILPSFPAGGARKVSRSGAPVMATTTRQDSPAELWPLCLSPLPPL
nr:uncharacterized protein LOC112423645 [Macaca nemestrina]